MGDIMKMMGVDYELLYYYPFWYCFNPPLQLLANTSHVIFKFFTKKLKGKHVLTPNGW